MPSSRRPYVVKIRARGHVYLYYRRSGERVRLVGPEGSAVFNDSYDQVHRRFEQPASEPWGPHTVGQGITEYLDSADFRQLALASQRQYRWALDLMRERIGRVLVADIDFNWVDRLRNNFSDQPHLWNSIRSRMREVFKRYRRSHPSVMPVNPWEEVRRLKVADSDQNRRWPDEVLMLVLREATPEFRALLITLLLTAQRISDVVKFSSSQFDRSRKLLAFVQKKTGKHVTLHVPDLLAETFEMMAGRHPERLLVTPRGRAWTTVNAEETLLCLRSRLGLERYTLHGLRATGPQALKLLGLENRAIRSLTGHDSDRNLEVYLRGIEEYPLARQAQEILGGAFDAIVRQSMEGANARKFSGVTGRAARKIAIGRPDADLGAENVAALASVKLVQNAKRGRVKGQKT